MPKGEASSLSRSLLLDKINNSNDVVTGVNYGVVSFLRLSKFLCSPKMGIARIRGSARTTTSF